jgi:hypothetical protein
MRLERRLEFRRRRLGDHVGQCADDTLLGIVDVLQLMDEQIVHRPNVLGKETHDHASLRSRVCLGMKPRHVAERRAGRFLRGVETACS